jgi:hypothetical protein
VPVGYIYVCVCTMKPKVLALAPQHHHSVRRANSAFMPFAALTHRRHGVLACSLAFCGMQRKNEVDKNCHTSVSLHIPASRMPSTTCTLLLAACLALIATHAVAFTTLPRARTACSSRCSSLRMAAEVRKRTEKKGKALLAGHRWAHASTRAGLWCVALLSQQERTYDSVVGHEPMPRASQYRPRLTDSLIFGTSSI